MSQPDQTTKTHRNVACPCGSGKKFKRCCLSRNIVLPVKTTNAEPSKEVLVKTLTDECFQPMRLYYIIHDQQALENCFKKLKCMRYDEELNDWVILYAKETAKIGLQVAVNKVPKEARPLIIATIYIKSECSMLIDVRSIERAGKMIEFIDRHVPKQVAEVTHAAIYNKLITGRIDSTTDDINVDFDDVFSQKNLTVIVPEEILQEAKEIAAQHEDQKERMLALLQNAEDKARAPLPKVEKFSVYYYEEGIQQFNTMFMMRQTIALQHYFGKKDFSFYDLTQMFLQKTSNELQIETE